MQAPVAEPSRSLQERVYYWLLARVPQRAQTVLHAIKILIYEMQRDQVQVRAATLSYWTLVAMVPVLVLAGVTQQALELDSGSLREIILNTLLAGAVQEEVAATLDNLLAQINFGGLGIAGLIGVLFAGSRIFFQAEDAFNHIWRATVRRSMLSRLLLFYAGVTLGPGLLAWGFHISSSLPMDPSWVSRMQPILLSTTAFVAGIRLLPDTHVRWGPASIGGLVAGMLFETAKWGFSYYVSIMGAADSASRLYGSLAAFPLFAFWLNVVWLIVLFGVEIAFVAQHWENLHIAEKRRLNFYSPIQPDAWFALQCLLVVAQVFQAGKGFTHERQLSEALQTDIPSLLPVMQNLCRAGLLLQVEEGWVLKIPAEQLQVRDAILRYRALTLPDQQDSSTHMLVRLLEGPEGMKSIAAILPPLC